VPLTPSKRARACAGCATRPSYWDSREAIVAILRFLAGLSIAHWRQDAKAARLLAGAVENDHV
jgi:hypothetical protein